LAARTQAQKNPAAIRRDGASHSVLVKDHQQPNATMSRDACKQIPA
jgi:hypothetical protein